jgi:hypothetical protein
VKNGNVFSIRVIGDDAIKPYVSSIKKKAHEVVDKHVVSHTCTTIYELKYISIRIGRVYREHRSPGYKLSR